MFFPQFPSRFTVEDFFLSFFFFPHCIFQPKSSSLICVFIHSATFVSFILCCVPSSHFRLLLRFLLPPFASCDQPHFRITPQPRYLVTHPIFSPPPHLRRYAHVLSIVPVLQHVARFRSANSGFYAPQPVSINEPSRCHTPFSTTQPGCNYLTSFSVVVFSLLLPQLARFLLSFPFLWHKLVVFFFYSTPHFLSHTRFLWFALYLKIS